MTCRLINDEYVVIDCNCCGGVGYLTQISEKNIAKKETCTVCMGTCLVRIRIEDIPVINGELIYQ